MKKSTGELFELLKSSSIVSYLEQESESLVVPPLHELLESFLEQKQIKKSQCIAAAGIQREYGYQIFSGIRKKPDRDKIAALCLAMHLTLEEADILLRAGGYHSLYPRSRRDSILINAFLTGRSVMDTNMLLYENGENPL